MGHGHHASLFRCRQERDRQSRDTAFLSLSQNGESETACLSETTANETIGAEARDRPVDLQLVRGPRGENRLAQGTMDYWSVPMLQHTEKSKVSVTGRI